VSILRNVLEHIFKIFSIADLMAIPVKQFFGESCLGWQCCVSPPTRLNLGLLGENCENFHIFLCSIKPEI
jgi:hypothetical protein